MSSSRSQRKSSVLATLDIVGDHWMLMVLREMFLGSSSWAQLARALPVSPSTLSKRLTQLIEAGCVQKARVAGGTSYRLTPAGRDLFPLLVAALTWQIKWDNPDGTLASPWRHKCGALLYARSACRACGQDVHLSDVASAEGPGAGSGGASMRRRFRNRGRPVDTEGPSKGSKLLQVMGDRRAAQVLAALYMGRHRFEAIEKWSHLHPSIVQDRLRKLQLLGLCYTRLYQERPDRYLYGLTTAGREMFPIVLHEMRWGDDWIFGAGNEPMILTHKTCGRRLTVVARCKHCDGVIRFSDATSAEPRTADQGPALLAEG